MEALITLCEECHNQEVELRPSYEQDLLFALREKFLAEEVRKIGIGFHMMPMLHVTYAGSNSFCLPMGAY